MCQLQTLARTVSDLTETLTKSLHNHPIHAQSSCGAQSISGPALDKAGEDARNKLIDSLRQLERLVLGPKDALQNMYFKSSETGVIQALCTLKVPQNIPLNGSVSYEELADRLNLNQDRLIHLVRNAIVCSGYLSETYDGKVCHSPTSAIWHLDPTMANGMEVMIDNLPLSAFNIAECVRRDPHDVDDSVCAFSVARNMPLFQWFETNPEQGRKFAAHMRAQSSKNGDQAVRDGYDWASLQGKTLVDCGGSFGSVGAAILSKQPDMNVIVQDLPKVIESAKMAATKANPPLPATLSFAPQSFLEPQPTLADVYLYRMVFHNWSDAGARKILRALQPALRPGTKVILIEYVMPKMGSVAPFAEMQTRRLDNVMYTLMNGKVRELSEFQALFQEVEPRLRFASFKAGEAKATHDPRSHSVMEWVFEEDIEQASQPPAVVEEATAAQPTPNTTEATTKQTLHTAGVDLTVLTPEQLSLFQKASTPDQRQRLIELWKIYGAAGSRQDKLNPPALKRMDSGYHSPQHGSPPTTPVRATST